MNVVRTVIRNPGIVTTILGVPGADGTGGGGGGSGTVTSITLTQPAAGLTITNSGVAIITSGTRTFALANDLAALEALSGTNTIYYRSAADTWTAVTIGANLSFSGGTLNTASSYEVPLTFSTGLTRTVNTITVNASQNISTLSNLTSNGLVTTSGGTGALSVTTLGSGVAAFLSTPSVANFFSALTGETGPWRGLATATSLGAISFARTNADDSVTMRSASDVRDDLELNSDDDVGFSTVNAENGLTAGGGGFTVDATGNITAPSLALSSGTVTNVPSPSNSTDAVNKSYVDSLVAGLKWKAAVRVATTTNGTLSTAFANGQTVDGVVLATGDRILLKDQSTGSQNGIYTVNASGAPTRATDADADAELPNAACFVAEGTTNADKAFVCTNNSVTLGSTSLTWANFAATTGALLAANNLSDLLNAGTARTNLGVAIGSNVQAYSATLAAVAAGTYAGATSITTLGTIATGVWNGTIITSAYGGTGNGFFKVSGPAATEKTFTFPNASATVLTDNAAVTVAQGGTGIASGTSGGIPYFSGSTTIASSAALAANALVVGGGAGAAPATVTTGTGVVTQLGLAADGSDVDAIGYRGTPQNAQTGSYTCVMADAGKTIYHASGAGAGDTYTIPANGSVAYEIGTAITFVNMDSNSVTIAITTDTLYLAGTGSTGSRTLAQYGIATAVKLTSTTWIISGTGLT